MPEHVEKSQNDKSRSVAHQLKPKRGSSEAASSFVDNRPEAIAQRRLQVMVNNSPQVQRAAQLQALTYAQRADVQVGPGQEHHLPHEAWPVVQQRRGRAKPTVQAQGMSTNDETGLEQEAARTGGQALQLVESVHSDHFPATVIAGSVLQKKRDSGKQTDEDFKGFKFGDNSDQVKSVKDADKLYEASLKSGTKVMTEGLKWFTDAKDRKPTVSKKDVASDIDKLGYRYFWYFEGDKNQEVTVAISRESLVGKMNSGEIKSFADFDDGEDSTLYWGTYNVATGEFSAEWNYKDTDKDIAEKEGYDRVLPNNRIIMFQISLAIQRYSGRKDAGKISSGISSIKRSGIGNTQTLATIFMSDNNRVVTKGGTETIDRPTQDAFALLGTPNGNSAVWLLIEHEDPGGAVDIESIEFDRKNLRINYLR